MIRSLVLLALAQAPAPAPVAPAGEPLTLQQVFTLADQTHADQKLAEYVRAQVEQDARASYAGILPRVDLNGSASETYSSPQAGQVDPYSGKRGDEIREYSQPFYTLGLRVTQNIFDGGRWWTNIAKGKNDVASADAQLAEARLQVHSSVAHLFYELVRAERSLRILEVNVTRSQEQLERAEALFEAGRGPKSDVFAAQVNLANDKIQVTQQRAKLELARNSLNVALGRTATQAVAPQPGDLGARPAAPNGDEVEKRAVDARPGLAYYRGQIQSAEYSATIARADYYPTLSASGSLQRGSPDLGVFFKSPSEQNSVTGSINLTWNLFNGRQTSVNVQKAEIAADQAREQLVKAERAVREEAQRTARSLNAFLEALALADQARNYAVEGLNLAQERFKAGAASNLEVRDAQIKLTSAELTLVSTQVDTQLAQIDLQAALGQL